MFNLILRTCGRVSHCKRILPFQRQNLSITRQLSNIFRENQKTLKKTRKSPVTWKTIGITSFFGGICLAYMYYLKDKKDRQIDRERNRQIGKASIGGSFKLFNSEGELIKSEDFLGKWVLIYFGFTHCPDICPEELEKLSLVVDNLEKQHKLNIQPLFITVDPFRDTPEVVAKYVKEFSDKIIGLSGSLEQIKEVCKAYRVYYSNGPTNEDNDYIVDHTIIVYLIDPEGNFADYYGQSHDVESVTASIMLNKHKFDNKNKQSLLPSFSLNKLGIST